MFEIIIPELAESVTEGTIVKWLVNVGDAINKGDDLVELETDKVNIQITSEETGVLDKIIKQAGETVEVGEVIGKLNDSADANNMKRDITKTNQDTDKSSSNQEKEQKEGIKNEVERFPLASPAARKLARKNGIDLREVKAKDPLGRIRSHDIQNQNEKSEPNERESQVRQSLIPEHEQKIERIAMSRRRQTIANHLVHAKSVTAMLTTFNEVDMTEIIKIRQKKKEDFLKKHQVKLGFMSFFTKAVVQALRVFPHLNAEIDGHDIILKKFYDIGIAVGAKEGLVVPVVRDVDKKSFAEIEQDIAYFADKARHNQLTLEDLRGGTFTITNGGTFGSLLSTPIINYPQVGILGMHNIQKRPITIEKPEGDVIESRPMMYIALSYDHRIVDGSEAVRFLVTIKQLLEDPIGLLLE
ncbi:2-oxoglutarate dehydrogenase complex dihydrolipoyllysine-residue succinyltransferase [Terrilactibacillus sp. BCM23-1]|uniref:Dihydrolipoyllysine-residue succinyltransferase component of 2-oxoglutarate dehydrogenase complex n=1 Tax=Terrilactibacillus tamarindi TaxID=2599694 RepID=A0A6N8CKW2_9BACI|nr:2-oxoglutarate dehydrogenase complex dihydrolipoyllysine-residue succinyltransferase [Terrilactibacillus tamarindi]MTT30439.1 2-oxoglutarate dehydrogenase complex dihydrolipoyllysine-residue succinyltransferase [Terrilactibacillus tamarindi]